MVARPRHLLRTRLAVLGRACLITGLPLPPALHGCRYCARLGIGLGAVKFMLRGERVFGASTPAELKVGWCWLKASCC